MPEAPYTTFVRLEYFRKCTGPVARFQDIPDEFKVFRTPVKLFLSHKWQSVAHPDQSCRTLQTLLNLTKNCDDNAGVWWDYCSLPQRNVGGFDDRTADLKDFFKYQLTLIPLIILDSQCMFLWSEDGVSSGWCCIELLIAQVLIQHLNKMIYTRKSEFKEPPLFVIQVDNETLIESDLVRFDHTIYQKLYCTRLAMQRHAELINWMNMAVNEGRPIPYSQLIVKVTTPTVVRMMKEQNLMFTNGADCEVVSKMLSTIYSRLSFEPFSNFKWNGQIDFFSTWHYVKGSLGGCLVPYVAYRF